MARCLHASAPSTICTLWCAFRAPKRACAGRCGEPIAPRTLLLALPVPSLWLSGSLPETMARASWRGGGKRHRWKTSPWLADRTFWFAFYDWLHPVFAPATLLRTYTLEKRRKQTLALSAALHVALANGCRWRSSFSSVSKKSATGTKRLPWRRLLLRRLSLLRCSIHSRRLRSASWPPKPRLHKWASASRPRKSILTCR